MRIGNSTALERGLTARRLDEEIDLALPVGTLERLVRLNGQHGDFYRLSTRGDTAETYVVSHPDLARQVLTAQHNDFHRSFLDRPMSLVLGNGLLTGEAEIWKQQRKALQPCFHGDALTRMFARSSACNRALLDRWQARVGKHVAIMELAKDVDDLSVELNFSALFGADANSVFDDIGNDFLGHLTAPLKADTRSNLLFLKQIAQVRARLLNLIAARRRDPAGAVDLLGMFLQVRYRDGGAMADRQILDELLNVLTAGHETIASALKSVWYLVSRNPLVVAAIRSEADRVLGDAPPRGEQVARLRFAKQVVQEAMRLYPPLWVIPRRAQRSARIGDWQVPAGANVFTFVYMMHRHPDFWHSPEGFDPERFAPAAEVGRHTHAYIPYGRGPRNCIGSDLSMTEMILHIATAVREFDVTHLDGSPGDLAAGVMLRPQTRIQFRMAARGRMTAPASAPAR